MAEELSRAGKLRLASAIRAAREGTYDPEYPFLARVNSCFAGSEYNKVVPGPLVQRYGFSTAREICKLCEALDELFELPADKLHLRLMDASNKCSWVAAWVLEQRQQDDRTD